MAVGVRLEMVLLSVSVQDRIGSRVWFLIMFCLGGYATSVMGLLKDEEEITNPVHIIVAWLFCFGHGLSEPSTSLRILFGL